MKNIGIVLAGGIGRRFGGDKPKQYFEICGKEMIAYSIELFREAIQWGATSLYVAHNHPSGDATPSKEDMEITITLLEASKILGIPMRDHVVIGTENSPGPAFVSIRERMEKQ